MRMRIAVAVLLALAWAGSAPVEAGQYSVPTPQMNHHPPYQIWNPHCDPCPFCGPNPYGWGLRGPTDPPGYPVSGLGAPPFGPRGWFPPFNNGGYSWHWYLRSPRDFYMEDP